VAPAPTPVAAAPAPSTAVGDGSAPLPGTDATTLHRTGGSEAISKPGYQRNPPPPYPAEARRLKQEGRVLLSVSVTAEGRVGAAAIKQSSGFPLLDDAALRGVQNWRFRAASVGGLRVASDVEIPIRFQLK
jgi:protein TonB